MLEYYPEAMSKQEDAVPERHANSSWRSGRPTRWRATADAELRQKEGVAKPGDAEPGVVEGLLRERVGLLDVLFDDRGGD
jgi:hypothetical protein